ncbi:MAG TPA: molybdopterin-dependent oxidoreductase [Egicoccus sp.]|nr:molybdopterin-dependent oxidoreductase [Egicoccus sp.]HSK22259.1 molybdopterin-dependent oxidoreductase [Egicoccus sp.]
MDSTDHGVEARVADLVHRADEIVKAAPARRDESAVIGQAGELLEQARDLLDDVADPERRRALAAQVSRRIGDLDRALVASFQGPSPGVRRAPTKDVDPARIPPNQHLTAGFPVLHVGRMPDTAAGDWRLTVTGLVERRTVFSLDDLRDLGTVTERSDFHCVTSWSRLDNDWTGVRVRDVIDAAGVKAAASHVIASGHPAYSANLDLEVVRRDDSLLAWAHDGAPLTREHGGPLRLVVPVRYGWKSVKWVTELRLLDRDVHGYWEERGYHDVADPFLEQRFA